VQQSPYTLDVIALPSVEVSGCNAGGGVT